MATPGSAIYMGRAFTILAKGMKEALGLWGKVGFHKGLPTVKDIPLIIKALSVHQQGVADEAHKTLVGLSGQNLGREPGAWEAWWEEHKNVLSRQEAAEKAAEGLFSGLQRDILTGRWETPHGMLSKELRNDVPLEDLRRNMMDSARILRTAYRDARIKDLRLGEGRGTLVVDWGASGFDFWEIGLVREGEGWKFNRLPWGTSLVDRAPEPVATYELPPKRRRRRAAFRSGAFWGIVLTQIGGAIPFWAYGPRLWTAMVIVAAAGLGVLVHVTVSRRRSPAGRRRAPVLKSSGLWTLVCCLAAWDSLLVILIGVALPLMIPVFVVSLAGAIFLGMYWPRRRASTDGRHPARRRR